VNLTIDEDVVKEAKEIGLNLSKIAENALKRAILALKNSKIYSNEQRPQNNVGNALPQNHMAGGTGFEPATTSLGGLCPILARLPALCISDLVTDLRLFDSTLFCV
jgi:hypothetical protein